MTAFLKSGNNEYQVYSEDHLVIEEMLPKHNYEFCFNPVKGAWLETIQPFEAPTMVYGNIRQRRDRICNTFATRLNLTTGVLLSGIKGSGKTSLLKMVALETDLPIINITSGFSFDIIVRELSKIQQPYVLIFDEFEKKYPSSNEDIDFSPLLSFLDGTGSGQKLVLITANDVIKLSDFLLNRPGRMIYHFRYAGLLEPEIQEYLNDTSLGEARVDEIIESLQSVILMGAVTYDILNCITEECTRYPTLPIQDLLNALNISLGDTNLQYKVEVYVDGRQVPVKSGREYVYDDIMEASFHMSCDYRFAIKGVSHKGKIDGWIDYNTLISRDKSGFTFRVNADGADWVADDIGASSIGKSKKGQDNTSDRDDTPDRDFTDRATIKLIPSRPHGVSYLF
jgi:hypothetical protein